MRQLPNNKVNNQSKIQDQKDQEVTIAQVDSHSSFVHNVNFVVLNRRLEKSKHGSVETRELSQIREENRPNDCEYEELAEVKDSENYDLPHHFYEDYEETSSESEQFELVKSFEPEQNHVNEKEFAFIERTCDHVLPENFCLFEWRSVNEPRIISIVFHDEEDIDAAY